MKTPYDDWAWNRRRDAVAAEGFRALGRIRVWAGRYRMLVPWTVDRRDLQRLVRATWLAEHGRMPDARTIWAELRVQPVEPRFGR